LFSWTGRLSITFKLILSSRAAIEPCRVTAVISRRSLCVWQQDNASIVTRKLNRTRGVWGRIVRVATLKKVGAAPSHSTTIRQSSHWWAPIKKWDVRTATLGNAIRTCPRRAYLATVFKTSTRGAMVRSVKRATAPRSGRPLVLTTTLRPAFPCGGGTR
jgi:hypothetical protein